jgi:antirestriction protein ArdC
MSAAFLCSHAGIQPTVIANQAAYLAGWLKQLKSDKKLVVSAAGQAQRAADWIRGERD